MKVGLVLEGGSMRGMFTAGVLDLFLDKNIDVDGIMGVSAGALFGPNFYSKQKGRVIRYNMKYAGDKRYISLRNLIFTGNAISKRFAFYKMQYKLDPFDNETFMKTGKPFYAVATNVKTGNADYLEINDCYKDIEKLRATSAIPLSSRIIKVDGNKYLDGGISDSIPVKKMMDMGYDKIIVVLTQPINYHKKEMEAKKMKMIKFRYHKYPNLINTIATWPQRYNETTKEIIDLENEGKIFVIRPPKKIWVSLPEKDANKLKSIYDMGYEEAEKRLVNLKKYLSESSN